MSRFVIKKITIESYIADNIDEAMNEINKYGSRPNETEVKYEIEELNNG